MSVPRLRLLVAEASVGGVVGGSLTGALEVIRHLDRARWRITLGTAEEKAPGDVMLDGIDRVRIPRRATFGPDAVRSRVVRRAVDLATIWPRALHAVTLLRRVRPDLVYLANGVGPHVPTILAAAVLRIPVVCHLKGYRRVDALDRFASGRVRTAVAMTAEIAEHYRRRGLRPGRLVTLPDGVDCDRFRPGGGPAVRRRLEIPQAARVVGIVGHLQEWKGQSLFLDAVARVRAELPDVVALVVGDPHRTGRRHAEAVRRRAAEADLAGSVVFVGTPADVAACIDAMDVVVHASLRPEPFGRVLIEAMAVGRPVIAPAEGGPREIVVDRETGLLVPPRDVGALAQAIAVLLRDPEVRAAMGRAARERACSTFGIGRHVQALAAVLEDAVA